CIAVVTALVDGFLARWLDQRSRLGALLDPIADKLLVLCALIVGVLVGAIPVWLAVIIVARDAVLAVGALLFSTRWRHRHGPAAWRPTRIGKYAMAMQSLMIALVIVWTTLGLPALRDYAQVAMLFTALLTLTAGGHVLHRRPPPHRRRPVHHPRRPRPAHEPCRVSGGGGNRRLRARRSRARWSPAAGASPTDTKEIAA